MGKRVFCNVAKWKKNLGVLLSLTLALQISMTPLVVSALGEDDNLNQSLETSPVESGQSATVLTEVVADQYGYELIDSTKVKVNNVVHISTAYQLAAIGSAGYLWTDNYVLDNDIDLTNFIQKYGVSVNGGAKSWKPIGYTVDFDKDSYFQGTFDGQGHTISGLYINAASFPTTGRGLGLFGTAKGSASKAVEFKNLNLADVNITSENFAAGLVVEAEAAIINNVTVSGNISSSNYYVGGIVSRFNLNNQNVEKYKISNSTNYANVQSRGYAGGIVGIANAPKIENCVNYGKIYGAVVLGGIAGQAISTISNSVNNGDITATAHSSGGIAGIISAVDGRGIINSVNNGKIEGLEKTGGITAEITSGIKDQNVTMPLVIKNNVNNGPVSAYRYSGGIAGFLNSQSGNITNNINNGTVSFSANYSLGTSDKGLGFGGIVGAGASYPNFDKFPISNNTNNGNVNCVDIGGGLVGRTIDTKLPITNNLNLGKTTTDTLVSSDIFFGSLAYPTLATGNTTAVTDGVGADPSLIATVSSGSPKPVKGVNAKVGATTYFYEQNVTIKDGANVGTLKNIDMSVNSKNNAKYITLPLNKGKYVSTVTLKSFYNLMAQTTPPTITDIFEFEVGEVVYLPLTYFYAIELDNGEFIIKEINETEVVSGEDTIVTYKPTLPTDGAQVSGYDKWIVVDDENFAPSVDEIVTPTIATNEDGNIKYVASNNLGDEGYSFSINTKAAQTSVIIPYSPSRKLNVNYVVDGTNAPLYSQTLDINFKSYDYEMVAYPTFDLRNYVLKTAMHGATELTPTNGFVKIPMDSNGADVELVLSYNAINKVVTYKYVDMNNNIITTIPGEESLAVPSYSVQIGKVYAVKVPDLTGWVYANDQTTFNGVAINGYFEAESGSNEIVIKYTKQSELVNIRFLYEEVVEGETITGLIHQMTVNQQIGYPYQFNLSDIYTGDENEVEGGIYNALFYGYEFDRAELEVPMIMNAEGTEVSTGEVTDEYVKLNYVYGNTDAIDQELASVTPMAEPIAPEPIAPEPTPTPEPIEPIEPLPLEDDLTKIENPPVPLGFPYLEEISAFKVNTINIIYKTIYSDVEEISVLDNEDGTYQLLNINKSENLLVGSDYKFEKTVDPYKDIVTVYKNAAYTVEAETEKFDFIGEKEELVGDLETVIVSRETDVPNQNYITVYKRIYTGLTVNSVNSEDNSILETVTTLADAKEHYAGESLSLAPKTFAGFTLDQTTQSAGEIVLSIEPTKNVIKFLYDKTAEVPIVEATPPPTEIIVDTVTPETPDVPDVPDVPSVPEIPDEVVTINQNGVNYTAIQDPFNPQLFAIADENGGPLGSIIIPEGANIEDVNITEELIPLDALNGQKENPKTGDNSNMQVLNTIVLCLCLLTGSVKLRKYTRKV